MKRVAAYTLGCKVNQYETEALLNIFRGNGYEIVDFNSESDIYIINSCTVTGMSDSKCRQIIRKARKNNPDSIIAVMGCYSQIAPDSVIGMAEVNIAIGTKNRKRLFELCTNVNTNSSSKIVQVDNSMTIDKFEELGVDSFKEHTRAFLKIQDGCTQFCSYCIIPYARGPVRSREPQSILEEIEQLAGKGYKEFVLTGIHLASYGRDLKNTSLTEIIREIIKIDGVERLRLGSIEPNIVTHDFAELAASSNKICRHFHLSLQSGSNTVLKRMNRKYRREDYLEKVNLLRNKLPDVAITTDIIVGFPGETDVEFDETLDFVKQVDFAKVHVFRYSRRKGTPAAEMDCQIDPAIMEERSQRLINLADELHGKFLSKHIGKTVKVLFEQELKGNKNKISGYTDNYVKVVADKPELISDVKGKLFDVMIIESKKEYLFGKLT